MPLGMPTGRGCEGCRKRKKKCDLAQPSCSRCTKYGIRCVGCGERVYRFKNATIGDDGAQVRPLPLADLVSKRRAFVQRPLGNELSKTVGCFISTLRIADPKYCIHGFGPFLSDVPRRLEQSDVLRTSALAFSTSVQAIYSDNRIAVQAIKDYGAAITCLRNSFARDPKEVKTADTLCGVYLLLLAQHFMGARTVDSATHFQGLMFILQSQSANKDKDAFTSQMIDLASLLMVTESITHPELELKPWNLNLKKTSYFGPLNQYSSVDIRSTNLTLDNLIAVAEYLQEPENHLSQLRSCYELMRMESQKLIPITVQLYQSREDDARSAGYVICESSCGVLHTITTIIRRTLQMFYPDDSVLSRHNIEGAVQILEAAKRAWEYRPLGTTYMPKTLCLTFATTDDRGLRTQLEDMIEAYRDTFFPSPTSLIIDFEKRFEDIRVKAQNGTPHRLQRGTTSSPSADLDTSAASLIRS